MESSEIDYCKRSLKALYEQRAWMDGAIEILETRLAAQERSEQTGSEVLEVEPARGGGSYVLQQVRCGKNTCHCANPGGELHGPYWYLYFKKDGRTRSKYIGKSKIVRGLGQRCLELAGMEMGKICPGKRSIAMLS